MAAIHLEEGLQVGRSPRAPRAVGGSRRTTQAAAQAAAWLLAGLRCGVWACGVLSFWGALGFAFCMLNPYLIQGRGGAVLC